MMTVFAKHMTLAVGRNAPFHVAHQFRRRDSRGNCEPFTLAQDVQFAAFGLPDHLGFERVVGFLKRWRRLFGRKFGEEVHAGSLTGLIHAGEIVAILYAKDAISQGVNPPFGDSAVLVFHLNVLPFLTAARDYHAHFLLEIRNTEGRARPIVDYAIGPSCSNRVERHHAKATPGPFERTDELLLMHVDRCIKSRTISENAAIL